MIDMGLEYDECWECQRYYEILKAKGINNPGSSYGRTLTKEQVQGIIDGSATINVEEKVKRAEESLKRW